MRKIGYYPIESPGMSDKGKAFLLSVTQSLALSIRYGPAVGLLLAIPGTIVLAVVSENRRKVDEALKNGLQITAGLPPSERRELRMDPEELRDTALQGQEVERV